MAFLFKWRQQVTTLRRWRHPSFDLFLLKSHFLLNHFILSSLFFMTTARGVTYLFDIQVKTFNHVYDGEDVIAQARTGTGKTFSFAIPLIEKLQNESGNAVRGRPPKVHTQPLCTFT